MAQVKDLIALTLADRWREVKADPWEELSAETLRLIRQLVEDLLVTELVAYQGADGGGAVRGGDAGGGAVTGVDRDGKGGTVEGAVAAWRDHEREI